MGKNLLGVLPAAAFLAQAPMPAAAVGVADAFQPTRLVHAKQRPLPGGAGSVHAPRPEATDAGAAAQDLPPDDEPLTPQVVPYTQATFDRAGWVNPYAPAYASGNYLVLVRIGDGVTLPGPQ